MKLYGIPVKCPVCFSPSVTEVIGRHLPAGFDPLMSRCRCLICDCEFWVAPLPTYREKEEAADAPPCFKEAGN